MKSKLKFFAYGIAYAIFLLLIQFIFFYRGTPPIYSLKGSGINLIPFKTLTYYITFYSKFNRVILIKQIFSCLLLLPLSIFLGFSSRSKTMGWVEYFLYFLFVAFLTSLLSRVSQVGVFEIDHVILRTFFAFGSFYLFRNLRLWRE